MSNREAGIRPWITPGAEGAGMELPPPLWPKAPSAAAKPEGPLDPKVLGVISTEGGEKPPPGRAPRPLLLKSTPLRAPNRGVISTEVGMAEAPPPLPNSPPRNPVSP